MLSEEEKERGNLVELIGVCKFCRQYVAFQWSATQEISEEEKIEQATQHCTCESAVWYQKRSDKIAEARMLIVELFTDPEEFEMQQLFLSASEMIADKKVVSIAAVSPNGTKGSFAITSADKIKIKRTESMVSERVI